MVLKRPLHCPTKVMESEAFETTVGEIVDGRRWALVTSAFWNTSDKVARLIEAAGPPAVAVTDVKPNPVLSDVIVLADWLGDAELIVALGGVCGGFLGIFAVFFLQFQEKLKSKNARVAYKLNVNSFRGNESLQLMIESIESA